MNVVKQISSSVELAQLLEEPLEVIEIASSSVLFQVHHYYRRVFIPKRSGGKRMIAEPRNWLKNIQFKAKERVLDRLPVSAVAHGFVKRRSHLTNAKKHIGKKYVLKLDLCNFFPSIKEDMVTESLTKVGFESVIVDFLVNICTFYPTKRSSKRCLPQGSCCSPVLSNIVANNLDKRLTVFSKNNDLLYTRYADDLTFSANHRLNDYIKTISRIISDEGFCVNWKKLRNKSNNRRLIVTGVVINDKANIPKESRREIRAILHNIEVNGVIDELHKYNQKNHTTMSVEQFEQHLRGRINFFRSVNPMAEKYWQQLQDLHLTRFQTRM